MNSESTVVSMTWWGIPPQNRANMPFFQIYVVGRHPIAKRAANYEVHLSVPQEMLDAARVDGASEIRTFFQIAMPLVLPAVAALAIILFLMSWNNYLWPLLVLNKPGAQTAPVALGALIGLNRVFWNAIMVAAAIMTLPMLVVFLFLQRYFIAGITAGAVK